MELKHELIKKELFCMYKKKNKQKKKQFEAHETYS